MKVVIGKQRRDGLYPVKYVYSAGKFFNKLQSYATIEAYILKCQQSGLTVDVYK